MKIMCSREFERGDEEWLNPTAIDTWDDYDISNRTGRVELVRFTGDKLIFMLWRTPPSFLYTYQRFCEVSVRQCDEIVEELEEERKGFEDKLNYEKDFVEKQYLIGQINMVALEIEDEKNQKISFSALLERIAVWKAAEKEIMIY